MVTKQSLYDEYAVTIPKIKYFCIIYRIKLIIHKFRIFNLYTHDGYCFMWHEGECEMKPRCFAAIMCSFLEKIVLPTIDQTKQNISPTDHISSIKSGFKASNPTVQDLRTLKYTNRWTEFKSRHPGEWKPLFTRRTHSSRVFFLFKSLSTLFKSLPTP